MRKQLFSNLGIKLSCLALALILWLSLYGEREDLSFIIGRKMELDVPVKVLQTPFSSLQAKVSPDKVRLTVTGSRRLLRKLSVRDVTAFIRVEDLKKGEYDLPLRVNLPPGIKIISKEPEVVKVALDDKWLRREPPSETLIDERD
ncbi:hypothetical protein LR007_01735 [candidate division NPL-UPA2 bacterium]|nr:hypothetical protein [candidate division NPL-UPA2 bacterium]